MSKKYMNLNKRQQQTIDELLKILPKAHFVDIKVRIDGRDKYYEADWLYDLLEKVTEL